MDVVIVTGMSGAGKTAAIKVFEDIGFFCVDNMLPELLEQFINIYMDRRHKLKNIAVGIDIRTTESFDKLLQIISRNTDHNINYKVIFLDSRDEVLVRRYKENRRVHPLGGDRRITDGLAEEREKLVDLRRRADYIIDTSNLLAKELKEEIKKIFLNDSENDLIINVFSFGFKYGVPNDVDMIFDIRFLPNPFYIEELKEKTGYDIKVQEYVLSFEEANTFIKKAIDMLEFLIPHYIKEGKSQLVVGIGCTGGQHRAVVIAREIFAALKKDKFKIVLQHREIKE